MKDEPKQARQRVEQALEHYENARRGLDEVGSADAILPAKLASACQELLRALPM